MKKRETVTTDELLDMVRRMVEKGETQADLSRKFGLSRGNMADMLAGRRSPGPIAHALGYTLKTFSKP
jgi:hypothetical protein